MTEGPADESLVERPVHVPVQQLLKVVVPAAVVGALCALLLIALSWLAEQLKHLVWDDLSSAVGADPDSAWWIIGVLTLTGVLVGLVVKYAPGHAGPDPAAHGLVEAPLKPSVTPGLALALVLMLAGGVSLGPENPIIAVNGALVVWLGMRLLPRVGAAQWAALAIAGTIGAMFGTPVAAALLFSELNAGNPRIPLWDRLFAPLVSATAGAIVMLSLSDLDLAIDLPAYEFHPGDLAIGLLIAVVTAGVGLLAVWAFVPLHRLFRRIKDPLVMLTVGGLVLGIIGAIGGPLSLFKGLQEMQELPAQVGTLTALGFLGLGLIKVLALLVAATSGFRGGRIFPALFAGVALGFGVHEAFPSVSLPLAVATASVGLLVVVARSGWLSIFMALAAVPDANLLPVLVLSSLGAWLVVANRRELIDPEPVPAQQTPPEASEVKPA